jgi:hypothetical protein
MRPEIFIWLFGVIAFWVLVWLATRRWQTLGLGITRVLFRTFAASLALAPTAIVAGYVGLPAPASLVILSYPFDSNRGHPGLVANTNRAIVCFFVFWAITFLISAFRFLWVYDRRTRTSN